MGITIQTIRNNSVLVDGKSFLQVNL